MSHLRHLTPSNTLPRPRVITLTDTIGDLTRPKAHIVINIVTNRCDDKGNEKIGFDALCPLMENVLRNTLDTDCRSRRL